MSETLALFQRPPSAIVEGQVLGGKYRLEREIGRGSMGTVWSAVHLTLGQRVAIKLISAEQGQSPDARRRFSTEAKAAARLRSRYVVQVYDDGETPAGTPYIVLEYLDGETLEQRLGRDRDLPLNDAVRVTRHVARALSRAHAQGIVHRDLKPGNVFLTRVEDDEVGWVAKVVDFGIAKVEELGMASTTKTGTLLGTPLYMSPEQVRGASSVDARSDLYSLGMVFFNMLTGTPAFNGEAFADLLVAICTGPLPNLRATAPWVPVSVAEWFQRACAREPQDRFQSADEMVEALDLALGMSAAAPGRQSSPELKLDTLRGYGPPVAHAVPRNDASDSGKYAQRSTQVVTTDRAQFASHYRSTPSSVDLELTPRTASRLPLMIGGGVVLCLLIGGSTFLLGRGKPVPPRASTEAASAAPRTLPATSPARPAAVQAAPGDSTPSPGQDQALPTSTATGSAPPRPNNADKPSAHGRPVQLPASHRNPAKTPGKAGIVPAAAPRNTSTDMGF